MCTGGPTKPVNEKLSLRGNCDEPRQFFFRSGILSLAGLALAFAGATVIGPTLFFAFLALGCILCFLASVPAFVLAWIPPVRRLLTWILRRRFLALACLLTLTALFYRVENWRGRRAWQAFKVQQEAKGERFDLASIIAPEIPEDQNFFETPLWKDLHFHVTNGGVVWDYTNKETQVWFDLIGPKHDSPGMGNWTKGQRIDLGAWQTFYRNPTNYGDRFGISRKNYPTPTNHFPVSPEPQTPGGDVLLALSRHETDRQLLIEAAARPHARFWVNYDAGFAAILPHLSRIKECVQYLSLHATAALTAGNKQAALEDSKLMFRLIESIRGEPWLTSFLVRVATEQIALQPLWEGLVDRRWTDTELGWFETELAKMDFLADYPFVMRGERALNLWTIDDLHEAGFSHWVELIGPLRTEYFSDSLYEAILSLVTSGWFDQNRLSLSLNYQRYCLKAVELKQGIVLHVPWIRVPGNKHSMQLDAGPVSEILWEQGWRPYDIFSRLLPPDLNRAAERTARAQSYLDLARLACALERYQLAKGQFPEKLDVLAPEFLQKLPHDVINGQPLRYHRTDDDRFVLYSVGWNGTDDGGEVELTKAGNPDDNKGDWSWAYPAR